MAEKATLARPYARAAFEHARSTNALGRWSELLAVASQVVSDARVKPLLGNPHVGIDQLVDLVAGVAGDRVDGGGRNFLRALADNRRFGVLPEIAAQFEALRAEVENVVDVEVIAAMEVSAAQADRLSRALKARLGRDVRLHTRIDASLIGGAIVRAGDLVIDGSLKGRLDRLAAGMTA
jgi:F-type H+-transporting ATPase subunit delta